MTVARTIINKNITKTVTVVVIPAILFTATIIDSQNSTSNLVTNNVGTNIDIFQFYISFIIIPQRYEIE